MCCPSKPLVKEFLYLLEPFDFLPCVSGPTHERGHTLDLVLSLGFSVDSVKIVDTVFSDHKTVILNSNFLCNGNIVSASVSSRILNPCTASSFSAAFNTFSLTESHSPCMGLEEFVDQFNSSCLEILDVVAPLKVRGKKVKSQPWLNSTTHALRQECRRAERKWVKDKLQVSYEYQRAVKLAKSNYFSVIISRNYNNSRVLFSTVNAVLHPTATLSFTPSADMCEEFLNFFIGKVVGIRSQILSVGIDFIPSVDPTNKLTSFMPVSLQQLNDITAHMKPTRSPGDVLPSSLFKKVLDSIGPSILPIMNISLPSGVVPVGFKHAVIQPPLKKNKKKT